MADKRPTSSDVARRAGVSRTTVSFVLNDRPRAHISEDTRRRVLAAAQELGYHVHAGARSLAAGRTNTIGLVLRQTPEQVAVDALLPETLRGLTTAAREAGFRVMVEPLPPADGSYAALVRARHTDGLIVSGPRADDLEPAQLHDEGYPLVVQGHAPGESIPSVDVDNRAGARVAVEHLIGLGHRRIGCITNASFAYTAAMERVEGYREALDAAGIAFDERLVATGDFTPMSGHAAMLALLARAPDLTAAFVASDVLALGAIGAAREAGLRVPDDLSIVGFDDVPLAAYFDPPLTTIRLPAYELGFRAGRMLVRQIGGEGVAGQQVLATELVVRASAAPPPDQSSRKH